jgi:plastocyanin
MKFPGKIPLVVAAWFLVAGGDGRAATIEGRVTLPKREAATVVNKRYEIVSRGGVVSTNPPVAVVYLDGEFPAAGVEPLARVEQKDLMFVPQLLVVRAGTKVEFPNLDDTFHNIFSYSPAKRFDLGRYRTDEKPVPAVMFDTPGVVILRCEIHEHMRGVILVLATPHFAITDTDGNYRLENLPAGTYRLKTWLDSQTTLERTVQLSADTRLRLDQP